MVIYLLFICIKDILYFYKIPSTFVYFVIKSAVLAGFFLKMPKIVLSHFCLLRYKKPKNSFAALLLKVQKAFKTYPIVQ